MEVGGLEIHVSLPRGCRFPADDVKHIYYSSLARALPTAQLEGRKKYVEWFEDMLLQFRRMYASGDDAPNFVDSVIINDLPMLVEDLIALRQHHYALLFLAALPKQKHLEENMWCSVISVVFRSAVGRSDRHPFPVYQAYLPLFEALLNLEQNCAKISKPGDRIDDVFCYGWELLSNQFELLEWGTLDEKCLKRLWKLSKMVRSYKAFRQREKYARSSMFRLIESHVPKEWLKENPDVRSNSCLSGNAQNENPSHETVPQDKRDGEYNSHPCKKARLV